MPLPVTPTILLAAASIALLCGWSLQVRTRWVISFALLIVGCLASYFLYAEPVIPSNTINASAHPYPWKNDGLASSEQWIVLGFGLLVGLSILDSPARKHDAPKFVGFLLFALAGMMLVASSNDFLALGLSLEIVSLALTALQRQLDTSTDRRSPQGSSDPMTTERRSANVWFNALSSAWMWLGIALLANTTSMTNFDELRSVMERAYDPGADQAVIGAPSKLILLACGLIAMSLFSRMGLVPFQLGFLSSMKRRSNWNSLHCLLASQFVGAMTMTRLFGYLFIGLSPSFVVLGIVATLATFALSAVAALRGLSQGMQSIRDLVTGLMLLQAGWLGIAPMIVSFELDHPSLRWGAFPHQSESIAIIVFTQMTFLLSGCGICGALCHLARADRDIQFLEDVKGLGWFAPLKSIALFVPLASLSACPWTAGFWGRWMTLLAGHNVHVKSTSGFLTPQYGIRTAILAGVLTTIVFAAIVFRLAREMYLESPLAKHPATGGRGPLLVSLITAIAGLLLGVAPQLALDPLKIIESPRAVVIRDPERGSGRNSLGLKQDSTVPRPISAWRQ